MVTGTDRGVAQAQLYRGAAQAGVARDHLQKPVRTGARGSEEGTAGASTSPRVTAGRSDIFTLSLHAEKDFPTRKARSSLDFGLPDATGDTAYLEALAGTLPMLLDHFVPDLILLQAGVDAHRDDRLGRPSLTDEGFRDRDIFVATEAKRRGIPLASTLGDGNGANRQPWRCGMPTRSSPFPRRSTPRTPADRTGLPSLFSISSCYKG